MAGSTGSNLRKHQWYVYIDLVTCRARRSAPPTTIFDPLPTSIYNPNHVDRTPPTACSLPSLRTLFAPCNFDLGSLAKRLIIHTSNLRYFISSPTMSEGEAVDFKLFRYDPNLGAAVLFVILFLIASALHTYQYIVTRTWFWTAFIVGCWCK